VIAIMREEEWAIKIDIIGSAGEQASEVYPSP
jgi:hypothetical protein